jgi:hypothetical protein
MRANRVSIETFKDKLKVLLSKINEIEREENQKNHIRDFLRDSYYSAKFEINTKDTKDLVIHNGKDSESSVGVIIEAKRPTNKSEMLTKENINAKALHELILYFLRERISFGNKEVKYLIATNIYEWFIFDAQEFEKRFAANKDLVKQFTDFEEKRLSGTKTDFFYKEIAEPFLANHLDISFTYFDIREYREALENNDPKDDVKLIALYKLLSPEHLLKLPFLNDSNSLDKSFYSELLHIIGLEETKDGSKKIIQRKKKGERNSASLIENTIIELDSLEKIHRIENPTQYGDTYEERLFTIAIELVITWVNRILFLKLLEAQQIKYHKGDENFSYLNSKKIKGYDDLNTLFFQVLSKPVAVRNEDVKKSFSLVPYLNSSLFELSDLEHKCFTISQLKDKNLPIYSGTVLKDNLGKKRNGEIFSLEYFFSFLDAYDFSSEGSEEIQEENKTLINASVLGLIFEKINGYKDGSFFTPGFITTNMCRETIRRAVVQKFNEIKSWNCKNFNELYNKIDSIEIKEANKIINSIRICDPAVGSGHFLVSALNEIIAIKSELGILTDRNGKRIKDYSVEVENDELIIVDTEDSTLFEYNPKNKESQRIQEALFHEKQTIIENCLFGVDINQNSVNICRLRLWIELLKNAYYISSSDSTELQTLPNIDINIKRGNSLISKHPLDSDIKSILKKRKWKVEDYKNAVYSYQNAKDKSEKREMENLIHNMKTEFIVELNDSHPDQVALRKLNQKLSEQSMFERSKKELDEIEKWKKEKEKLEIKIQEAKDNKIYQNSFEWRFEFPEVLNEDGDFVGFDVVIGNPPYIYIRDIPENERVYYSTEFYVIDDLYSYFIIQGNRILKTNGYISLITPNTYFTLATKLGIRELLLKNDELRITYSGYCFDDAYVETLFFNMKKTNPNSSSTIELIQFPGDFKNFAIEQINYDLFKNNFLKRFYWPSLLNNKLYNRFNLSNRGIIKKFEKSLLGKKETENIEEYINSLSEKDITLLGIISEGEQGLVTGNNSKYIANIVESDEKENAIIKTFIRILNEKLSSNYSIDEFKKEKIKFYNIAEELKKKTNNISLFGKFFNYKCIKRVECIYYDTLSEQEKQNGTDSEKFIFYNRGNSEGYKWTIPFTEAILWSKEAVKELREGKETNSRWQGDKFFNTSGFGWVDYFTDRIKAFYIEAGVYSKNIVKLKSKSPKIPDFYLTCLLNSSFISYYAKNFITSTHTLQINDGRLIPVVVPSLAIKNKLEVLFKKIIEAKKKDPSADTIAWEKEIDALVYTLYGLSEEEIAVVEGATK